MRHAEVAPHPVLRGPALAVADHHHLFARQPRHAAGHGLVVAIGAIPVNLAEIGENSLDQIHGIGPLGMPRPLDPDPRRRGRLRLVGDPLFLFAHQFLAGSGLGGAQDGRSRRLCRFYGAQALGTNHPGINRLLWRGKPKKAPSNFGRSFVTATRVFLAPASRRPL